MYAGPTNQKVGALSWWYALVDFAWSVWQNTYFLRRQLKSGMGIRKAYTYIFDNKQSVFQSGSRRHQDKGEGSIQEWGVSPWMSVFTHSKFLFIYLSVRITHLTGLEHTDTQKLMQTYSHSTNNLKLVHGESIIGVDSGCFIISTYSFVICCFKYSSLL